MNRRNMLAANSALLLLLSLAIPADDASAQGAKQLVGSWTAVSSNSYNPNPRGMLIFNADGYYSLTLAKASLPKFASNSRIKGTAEENQAVVAGSITHFGKYTVNDKDKTLTLNIEASTYPNFDGTSQTRPFSVSGDQLKYITPTPSAGGKPGETVWKRRK
jgi:Lipocalin-like domain